VASQATLLWITPAFASEPETFKVLEPATWFFKYFALLVVAGLGLSALLLWLTLDRPEIPRRTSEQTPTLSFTQKAAENHDEKQRKEWQRRAHELRLETALDAEFADPVFRRDYISVHCEEVLTRGNEILARHKERFKDSKFIAFLQREHQVLYNRLRASLLMYREAQRFAVQRAIAPPAPIMVLTAEQFREEHLVKPILKAAGDRLAVLGALLPQQKALHNLLQENGGGVDGEARQQLHEEIDAWAAETLRGKEGADETA